MENGVEMGCELLYILMNGQLAWDARIETENGIKLGAWFVYGNAASHWYRPGLRFPIVNLPTGATAFTLVPNGASERASICASSSG